MIPKILTKPDDLFPDISQALPSPNGLLAIGGDLSMARLMDAYQHGIFPWYSQGQPILWWSPDPRAGLDPKQIKIARSLVKVLRHRDYYVTLDTAFENVIQSCAAPRAKQKETWILPEMQSAYFHLHEAGLAHSIEVWSGSDMVGGLYGIDCGRVFTGESMFSIQTDAAKIALFYLAQLLKQFGYLFLDCQIQSDFLHSFGAIDITRRKFSKLLKEGQPNKQPWQQARGEIPRVKI